MKTRYWLVPLWIACGAFNYYDTKSLYALNGRAWPSGDRLFWAFDCVAIGPLGTITAILQDKKSTVLPSETTKAPTRPE